MAGSSEPTPPQKWLSSGVLSPVVRQVVHFTPDHKVHVSSLNGLKQTLSQPYIQLPPRHVLSGRDQLLRACQALLSKACAVNLPRLHGEAGVAHLKRPLIVFLRPRGVEKWMDTQMWRINFLPRPNCAILFLHQAWLMSCRKLSGKSRSARTSDSCLDISTDA